jgi:hypothetical protein
MNFVKKLSTKMKAVLAFLITGIAIIAVTFRKKSDTTIQDDIARKQAEEVLRIEADRKLQEEKDLLDREAVIEAARIQEERLAKEAELQVQAAAEQAKLETLAKQDKQEFKAVVEERLGIKEKKRKTKRKK